MSGESVLKDGSFVAEFYGKDLEKLHEGNTVGVMRTSQVCLSSYIKYVQLNNYKLTMIKLFSV